MRSRLVLAVAALLIMAGATVAFAAIPHSTTGVITGCYKTSNPSKGSVIVIDAEAGANCPSGYTQLTWNQTGPQGPAGVTGDVVVQASVAVNAGSGPVVSVEAFCPSGKVATGGGASVPQDQNPDVSWALQNTNAITSGGHAIGWNAQARRYGGESTNVGSLVARVICVTAS